MYVFVLSSVPQVQGLQVAPDGSNKWLDARGAFHRREDSTTKVQYDYYGIASYTQQHQQQEHEVMHGGFRRDDLDSPMDLGRFQHYQQQRQQQQAPPQQRGSSHHRPYEQRAGGNQNQNNIEGFGRYDSNRDVYRRPNQSVGGMGSGMLSSYNGDMMGSDYAGGGGGRPSYHQWGMGIPGDFQGHDFGDAGMGMPSSADEDHRFTYEGRPNTSFHQRPLRPDDSTATTTFSFGRDRRFG
mmetsp:Transcript_42313/g.42877  ORF Transcript_42313/g.42877 Transcript_42313/m.42877 type:complete len:239 (-) Transcript_42313:441-1157(-)|eukprot:CAMPEP_0171327408 /NCGR_PEP_ID=MMETSP0816-20121228/118062_1 /TAXON_ID=420281 /ORGANISM="Proboscia inermis, Strain CCAP1064/1" /LENGTH=238 /DNA_ID=CAMNT_0011827129 /DNA_START=208 /DNA_END=924 /DNA_ORIENTATION=+